MAAGMTSNVDNASINGRNILNVLDFMSSPRHGVQAGSPAPHCERHHCFSAIKA